MFGNIDAILRYNPDFLVDYLEIPGTSIQDASKKYTFRLQEQENIAKETGLSKSTIDRTIK